MIVSQALSVRFRTEVIDADSGVIVRANPWTRNLILDVGLENMASNNLCDLFSVLVLGTGTAPTKRDSGNITCTITGATATATAGFFEAADVGRTLKLDALATEYRVTGYTSPTVVTVATAGTGVASEFTIWYGNATTHEAELLRVKTYATDAGFNGSTYAAGVWTHRRTFLTYAFGTPRVIKEVAWSHSETPGAALFGRALVPGGGDAVAAAQAYRCQVEVLVAYGPTTPQPLANVCADAGFSTAGQWALEYIGEAPRVAANGTTNNGGIGSYGYLCALEGTPGTAHILISTASAPCTNMSAASTNAYADVIDLDGTPVAFAQAYVAGSHRRLWTRTFPENLGNSNAIRSVYFGTYNGGFKACMRAVFDAPQTKDSLHRLSFTFGLGWGRVLNN